jgi:hypothetical protein
MKQIYRRLNLVFPSPVSPAFLLDGCWKNCQRAQVAELGVLPIDIIAPWCSTLVYPWGINTRPIDSRSSEPYFHPIEIIIIIIIIKSVPYKKTSRYTEGVLLGYCAVKHFHY